MTIKPYKVIPGFYTPDGNYTLEDALRSIGPGWKPLIEELWLEKTDSIHVEVVKSKMGTLTVAFRADTNDDYQKFEEAVDEMAARSTTICEECGNPARLRFNEHELYRFTLCDRCAKNGR